jgi:hypothetical protein
MEVILVVNVFESNQLFISAKNRQMTLNVADDFEKFGDSIRCVQNKGGTSFRDPPTNLSEILCTYVMHIRKI